MKRGGNRGYLSFTLIVMDSLENRVGMRPYAATISRQCIAPLSNRKRNALLIRLGSISNKQYQLEVPGECSGIYM